MCEISLKVVDISKGDPLNVVIGEVDGEDQGNSIIALSRRRKGEGENIEIR